MPDILIVDDEKEIGNFLSHLLMKKGYGVTVAYNGKGFETALKKPYQLALIDLKLPDCNGLDLLKVLKKTQPACRAIIMTGYSTIQTAIDAVRLGASDYIEKPFESIKELENQIEGLISVGSEAEEYNIAALAGRAGFIVGKNERMRHLANAAYKIASKPVTILIEGETGTGKEVLARFIHESSNREGQPFIGINCGALSETLLESELFGHEKGAFTGATQLRKGLFEIASSGTLFLDEIAEASPQIQVKLLRILETREFMRIGGEKTYKTNARILAATHRNLEEAVKGKVFREDLFYRLNVVRLSVPPLRERKEDIPLYVANIARRLGYGDLLFTEDAVEKLKRYSWPGNLRELVNAIASAAAFSEGEGPFINAEYLPDTIRSAGSPNSFIAEREKPSGNPTSFKQNLEKWCAELNSIWESEAEVNLEEIMGKMEDFEDFIGKAFVKRALRETYGDRKKAASLLKISMRRLRYLLNEKGSR